MSKTVDERVLEMRFNNQQFESNVRQSMSTLERLKSALKFNKGADGLDKIGKAAKNVNLNSLASSVDQVKSRFSALDVVAVTALANITNSAVNAGKKMVKALTLEPVMTGFKEYETKINAVQTIMANTSKEGMTMQDVTNVLDDLNHYADKTIYNFTEMTRNIGTFTAAGVGLYDAAGAIKGIANLAAVSGSNSYQASTAMYQLSQALATGTVKLMDWNSVVNAGMGGTKFQEALKQTAREMGVAVDSIIEKNGSFRDSLQEGWLSADILNQTLKNFTVEGAAEYAQSMLSMGKYTQEQADALMREAQIAEDAATKVKTFTQLWDVMKEAAQSGWAQTWEIIIGDFEEAKEFLTPIADLMSNVIAESANARNSILQSGLQSNWKTLSNDIRAAGIDVNDFQNALIEVGKAHGVITDEMIVQAGGFEQSLKSGWASGDIFAEALRSYKITAEEFGITTESMQEKLTDFQQTVREVWDSDLVTQQERMRALADAGYDYNEIQGLIDQTLRGQALTLDDLSVAQLKALGFTQDEIMALQDMAGEAETTGTAFNQLIEDLTKPSGRELLLESFTNVLFNLVHIMDVVKQAWRETFPPLQGSTLYHWLEALRDLTQRFSLTAEGAENLRWTLRGVFSIFHMLSQIVAVPLKIGLEALVGVLKNVHIPLLEITGAAGRVVVWFDKLIFSSGRFERMVRLLPNTISKVVSVLKMWVEEFKELPQVQAFVLSVQETFDRVLSAVMNKLHDVGGAMGEFIDRIREMDMIHLTDLPNIFKDFYDNVLSTAIDFEGIFSKIKESMSRFFDMISSVAGKVVNVFSGMAAKLSAIGGKIKSVLRDNLNLSDFLAVLMSGGTIAAIMQFAKVIDLLVKPFEGIGKVLSGLEKIENAMAKQINAKAWLTRAKAIKVIATSILELAAAMWVLAQIPSDKLGESLAVLGILAAGIAGFAFALRKIEGPAGLEKSALMLIAFGTAIALLAGSLKTISDIDTSSLVRSVAALEIVMGSFALMSGLLGSRVASFTKGSRFLLSFSVAIKVLVNSLDSLSKVDVKSLPKTLSLMVAAIGMLAALAKIGSGVDWKAGLSMVAMVATIKMIQMMMDDLAKINIAQALKAAVGIIPILLTLKAMMLIISDISVGPGVLKGSGALAIMSGAILLLATAMRMIADLSVIDTAKGIVAINSFLLSFAAILLVANQISKHILKAGASFVLMSVAIGILAGVMVLMSKLDPSGMGRALAAILLLEGAFIALVAVSKYATAHAKTITALTVSVAALAATAAVLSLIDPAGLARGTVALTAIMGMFTLLVRATAVAKKANAAIFIMLGVVGALAAMLVALAQLPVDASIASATALSILLVTMTGCLYALAYLKPGAMKGIGALAVLSAIVAELAVMMAIMEDYDVNPSIETAKSLSILLAAMTGVTAALSGVGLFADAKIALKGISAMAVVVAGVGGLLTALGALRTYFPIMEDFINNGITMLNAIASGLGQAIGNLVGGLAEGFSSHLGAMADNLSDFMERLSPFLRGAKKITPEMADGISSLAEMLLKLTGADFVNSITGWITGGSSLTDFAESLIPFGEALSEFASKTKNINADQMGNVVNSAKALAEMADSLPDSGGLKQKITGVKDMISFMDNLDPLADALVNFSRKISAEGAINVDIMNQVTQAAQKLADLANALPKSGGLREAIVGSQDMAKFAKEVVKLGEALTEFSTQTGDINVSKMNQVSEAAAALVELNNNIPAIGGLAQFFAGEKNLETFGNQLCVFGSAMAAYSASVSGKVDKGAIDASANAAQALVELANNLPDPGFFATQYNFEQFGRQLASFGDNFATYAASIASIDDMSVVEQSAAVAESMVSLLTKLPKNEFFTNETWLDEFGYQLTSFGNSFKSFYESVKDIEPSKMDGVVLAAGSLTDMSVAIASVDMTNFTNLVSTMRELVKLDLDTIGTSMNDFATKLVNFSKTLNGVKLENIDKAVTAVDALVKLQEMLPDDKLFVNETWIDDFGYKLASFGNNFKKFADSVKDITPDSMSPTIDAANLLADLATSLQDVDLSGFKNFTRSISTFGRVGGALMRFQNAVQDLKPDAISPALGVVKELSTMAKEIDGLDTASFETTITGFEKLAKKDLSNLSGNIEIFGKAMKAYSDAMGEVNVDTVTASAAAGESLAALADSMPDPGVITTKLTLTSFADQLEPFAKGMKAYSDAIEGFKPEAVTQSISAGESLAALANNLPDMGGIQKIFGGGKMNLAEFAAQLVPFGWSMGLFSKNIGDFKADAVIACANAGQALSALAQGLPTKASPLVEFFSGGQINLAEFAAQLVPFGWSMGLFSKNIGDFKEDAVIACANAGQALLALSNSLPTKGSPLMEFFSGGQMNLAEFAAQLVPFGFSMGAFSAALGNFSEEKVVSAANAGQAIAALMTALPEKGGLNTIWSGGQTSLSSMAAQLPEFGRLMNEFSTNLGQFSADKITSAANAGKAIADLMSNLPKTNSNVSLTKFGQDMVKFAEQLQTFNNTIPFVNVAAIGSVASALQQLGNVAVELNGKNAGKAISDFADGLKNLATVSINDIVAEINGGAAKVKNAVLNLMNAFNTTLSTNSGISKGVIVDAINGMVAALDGARSRFGTAATSMMHTFNTAIQAGLRTTKTAFQDAMNAAVTGVRSKYAAFVGAGGYVVQGLIVGMNQKVPALMAAAQGIADKLSAKIKNAMEIKSPSKVTQRFGNYIVEGLAKGMTDNAYKSNKAGEDMARAVITAMQKELQINSPSIVARDEVGKYIIEGIAEGIEEDMSAEDAAAKKAQNIIEAFQNEVNKYSRTWNTADLQWQLFETMYGDTIGEVEMNQYKYQHQQDQMRILGEEVALAEGKYKQMVETFGEGSEEAKDAMDEFLQAQIELAKVAKENRELIKTINEGVEEYNKVANESYARYQQEFGKYSALLDKFPGMFTYDQIEQAAQERTGFFGYDQKQLMDTAGTIKSTFEDAMSGVSGLYSDFAKSGFGQAIEEYAKTGQKLVSSTANAVKATTPKVEAASGEMADAGVSAVESRTEDFSNAGEAVGSAFVSGIESQIPAAQAAANKLVDAANTATNAVKSVQSSSSKISPGGGSGKTIWNDFETYGATLNKGIGKSGHQTIPGTSISYESLDAYQAAKLSGSKIFIQPGTTDNLAKNIATEISDSKAASSTTNVTNNYTMTQNNTSPKAISEADVYRQTKTLFNSLKVSTSAKSTIGGTLV